MNVCKHLPADSATVAHFWRREFALANVLAFRVARRRGRRVVAFPVMLFFQQSPFFQLAFGILCPSPPGKDETGKVYGLV